MSSIIYLLIDLFIYLVIYLFSYLCWIVKQGIVDAVKCKVQVYINLFLETLFYVRDNSVDRVVYARHSFMAWPNLHLQGSRKFQIPARIYVRENDSIPIPTACTIPSHIIILFNLIFHHFPFMFFIFTIILFFFFCGSYGLLQYCLFNSACYKQGYTNIETFVCKYEKFTNRNAHKVIWWNFKLIFEIINIKCWKIN